MELDTVRFVQNDKQMYIGKVAAKDIVSRFKVDYWSSDKTDGYQRRPSPPRYKEFGRFVKAGNTSPPSILVNIRPEDAGKVNFKDGKLIVPDNVTFWVVDGQHRVEGLKWLNEIAESLKQEFELPVIFMISATQYEEAKQFVVINQTQKRIRTDLAERFLQKAIEEEGKLKLLSDREKGVLKSVLKGVEWKVPALEIADVLNNDKNSVWYQRILLPDEPRGSTTVHQKSFTDSLRPVLTNPNFQGKAPGVIASILNNYWDAIKEVCSEPFENPDDYVIMKTTGVFVLHQILPRVAEKCRDSTGRMVLTKEKFLKVFAKLQPEMSGPFWSRKGQFGLMGTSQKSFGTIANDILLPRLEEVEEETVAKDIVY